MPRRVEVVVGSLPGRPLAALVGDGLGVADAVARSVATTGITDGRDITGDNTGPRIALAPFSGDWDVASRGDPSGRDISGRLLLNASTVCRDFAARNGVLVSGGTTATRVMEYADIGPSTGNASNGGYGAGIVFGGYTLRYSQVHNFSDGLKLEGGLVEYCWVRDLTQESSSDHNDGIQASSGSDITIRGSRISRTEGFTQTSCVLIGADLGNISGVLIEDNLFESSPGFQVCLYFGSDPGFTATGGVIRDNWFTDTFQTLISSNQSYTSSGNRFLDGSDAPV